MSLCWTRRNDAHKSAFVKSSYLRRFVGELRFKRSLPSHDYIQRLIEHFRESSSPERMRRVVFSPDKIVREYASASCHLPGAYAEFFPCPHCTHTDEEGSFFEVFHFPNVHKPNVCATATFVMPADGELNQPTGCSVKVEFTKGCPNAPFAVDHSPRVALHIHTDIFIEVLRFLPRSELEKALLVSRRWSNTIGGAEGSLRQRRCFLLMPKFFGESLGMLSVYFLTPAPRRIHRVLTPRGLSQALYAVRSHLRNALVDVFPLFDDRVPPPGLPREMLVNIPLPERIGWLNSLLRPRPLNAEFRTWVVASDVAGFGNLPTLARCALQTHRKHGYLQKLRLCLYDDDATWPQLAGLLNQPSIRGFREITIVTTKVAIDTSELRAILSSLQTSKLHFVVSGAEPQDALLKLPAQIIRDFLAPRNATNFIDEFSLLIDEPDNVAFSEMPNVDNATNRRKRFRYHNHREDIVVRVSVYRNRTARKNLTVVTFDHLPRAILFLNGNVSLADLKSRLQRPSIFT